MTTYLPSVSSHQLRTLHAILGEDIRVQRTANKEQHQYSLEPIPLSDWKGFSCSKQRRTVTKFAPAVSSGRFQQGPLMDSSQTIGWDNFHSCFSAAVKSTNAKNLQSAPFGIQLDPTPLSEWKDFDTSEHSLLNLDTIFDDIENDDDDNVPPLLPPKGLTTPLHRTANKQLVVDKKASDVASKGKSTVTSGEATALATTSVSADEKKAIEMSRDLLESFPKLKSALDKSRKSLEELQKYEFYVLELPRCHSRTVSKSNKSRKRLIASMEPPTSKKRRTKKN